ncbi:MAG: GNAT family N-acetyltransferase [Opitutae bacterium]|nr:GNAT family N-acetyltransferase [Opitutae bacterium]
MRPATNGDAPAIWTLITDVLRSHGIITDCATTDRDLVDIEASYLRPGGKFFVLLDETAIIGTVALRHESAESCELCRMYLAAEHRGRGLGQRLLEHALAEARADGYREVTLKTAAVLETAIAMYRWAGFVPDTATKTCGNCNLAMRLRLS